MKTQLVLPKHLQINSPKVKKAGYENSAEKIFALVQQRLGWDSFADKDILDVGCGSRFTLAIINRQIPVQSYTGIEINQQIVDFFQQEVAAEDPRFHYAHWNVHNDMYNPDGISMTQFTELPVPGDFDLIWLFSVFTHLNPEDALALLVLMRRKIRPTGRLFFTTHTRTNIDTFEDRIEDKPLLRAFYNPDYLASLVVQAGWKVESFHDKQGDSFVKSHFVCSPA
jgi:SAM-dependent methyltransferase